jgi:uncharacterized membrane protein
MPRQSPAAQLGIGRVAGRRRFDECSINRGREYTMGAKEFVSENVIAVSFAEDSRAYEALTTLKELGAQGQINVEQVAVVSRDDDGRIEVKDQVGDESLAGTASGGLVGVLVGILGGPFGVLLGGATGLFVGSLFDLADAEESDSVLTEISKTAQVGHTALLAHVIEPSAEVVDAAMAKLSGTVLRRPVYEVEAEIAEAQEAQREAKKQARKQLRDARFKKNRDEAHEKVEELKAKLHGDRKTATTSS